VTFVTDHVHGIAPVALIDKAQPPTIAIADQPSHGVGHTLENTSRLFVRKAGNYLIEERVVCSLIEIGLEANRQPNTVIRMRDLVDVFEIATNRRNDAVRHGAVLLLLAQCAADRIAHYIWLDIHHPHAVLEVVAGLGVCRQPVGAAVVVNLARQPVIDELIEVLIRCVDLQATLAAFQVRRILLASGLKSTFAQVAAS
jgi:hypothetical protein